MLSDQASDLISDLISNLTSMCRFQYVESLFCHLFLMISLMHDCVSHRRIQTVSSTDKFYALISHVLILLLTNEESERPIQLNRLRF